MALASANGWRRINGGHVATLDCLVHHRTVRCAGQPKDATTNSTAGRVGMERNYTLFVVWCAPNSPMHPRLEGNQGLLNKEEIAPRSLGTIKGHLGAMEHYTSIL
jgi:hypothetical protein